MKLKKLMKLMKLTTLMSLMIASLASTVAHAEPNRPQPTAEQQLLQRIYNLRSRFEQERQGAENQARANVQLVTQSRRGADTPTVSGLRQQTHQSLARFEQQFRCLDVDLENTTGNTVVVCGDNNGAISGSNVSANRDIVTVQGGTP